MKLKKALVVASILLCLLLGFSGCVAFYSDNSESYPSAFTEVLIYGGKKESGETGYFHRYTLNMTSAALTEAVGRIDASAAAQMVDDYLRPRANSMSWGYSSEGPNSDNGNYYCFNFEVFHKADDNDNPYLEYEMTKQNLFAKTYTFKRDNPLKNFISYFQEGGVFADYKSVFGSYTEQKIEAMPVYYYIDCGSSHIKNNGEGTRTLYDSENNRLVFGFWKASIGAPPELIYYRTVPVTYGWNIVAIAAGAAVIAAIMIYFVVKAKKKQPKE